MRKDVQTDMTKLIVVFRNFVNTPKNVRHCVHYFAMKNKETCGGGTARSSGCSFSCMHLAQRKHSQWHIVKGQRQWTLIHNDLLHFSNPHYRPPDQNSVFDDFNTISSLCYFRLLLLFLPFTLFLFPYVSFTFLLLFLYSFPTSV
jgi:hypothetical protein